MPLTLFLPRPLRTCPPATGQAGSPRHAKRTDRRAGSLITRASDEEGKAQDSSAYRAAVKDEEDAGLIGKLVSNLPDGRKASAPESYGSRPESRTLTEGRYRRPPPERVGGVTESNVRGEDFEVVDGPSFGVGTIVGLLVAAATLGAVYLTVQKLGEGPVQKKGSVRMPERDSPAPVRVVAAPEPAEVAAPEVALE